MKILFLSFLMSLYNERVVGRLSRQANSIGRPTNGPVRPCRTRPSGRAGPVRSRPSCEIIRRLVKTNAVLLILTTRAQLLVTRSDACHVVIGETLLARTNKNKTLFVAETMIDIIARIIRHFVDMVFLAIPDLQENHQAE